MDQRLTQASETDPTPATPVLECRNLCISYFTRAGEIPAVVDFNLKLMPGEAQGIVGESGCGKSTVALAIMQYLGRNGKIVSRRDPLRGPRHDDDERGGASRDPRLQDRHGLPVGCREPSGSLIRYVSPWSSWPGLMSTAGQARPLLHIANRQLVDDLQQVAVGDVEGGMLM